MDNIDFEQLRKDLIDFLEGAYFVGSFGAALIERQEVMEASNEELISIALRKGFDLNLYLINDENKRQR